MKKYAILWIPPLLLTIVFLCYSLFVPAAQWIADNVLFCFLYEVTGLYCLGCGATRSVMSLLHGNIPLAFHNNPAIPVLLLAAVLFYAEKVACVFDKKLQLVPRAPAFWITLLVIHIIWAVIRNFVPAMQPI